MPPLSYFFWILYVVALFFVGFGVYRADPAGRIVHGGGFILWVLLGLLGWIVTVGPVVK